MLKINTMSRTELQNNIIRKVINTNDNQLLDYFKWYLKLRSQTQLYTNKKRFEKTINNERLYFYPIDKVPSNEDVFSRK